MPRAETGSPPDMPVGRLIIPRPNPSETRLGGLRLPLALTWAGLWAERITRAFWPVWSVVLAVLGAAMLGLQDLVPLWVVWVVATLIGVALIWLGGRGVTGFHAPRRDDALDRLDATMEGRPIQAMLDAQAIGAEDTASRAVWAAHQQRARTRALKARAPAPDLRVSRRDPMGLRYVALLAFVVALLFGSFWRMTSLTQMMPGASGLAAQAAAGPSWEGWIEPPGYTGLPVLYLNDFESGAITAPSNSRITLRFYGAEGALSVDQDIADLPPPEPAEQSGGVTPRHDAGYMELPLQRSGRLEISGDGGRRWDIVMLADLPPEIEATGAAETSASGAFTMPFEARDDYEVVSGRALISLDIARVDRRYGLATDPEPRDAIEVQLPMPVARSREDFEEVLIEDFSEHPWANLPVRLTLEAMDAAGNIGTSPVQEMDLAARHFFDPLAAAVIEMRRDLLWNRDNASRVAQVLRAVSHRPAGLFKQETAYLRLRVILRRLETMTAFGLKSEQRDEIAAALWDLALQLEEGTLADALERMRQAQARLEEAMKNGASDAEIARLMDELREATRDYMEQLQRQFAQDQGDGTDRPDQGADAQDSLQMTQDDLQQMMDRIQELMEQGRMAEAMQALQEFQQMMENMRITQGEGGQGQSPGQRAMEGLADTLRDQQGLSDQAFRDLQEQFNPGADAGQSQGNEGQSGGLGRGQSHDGQGQGQGEGQGEGQAQQGTEGQQPGARPGAGAPSGQTLAQRQEALRRQLDQQRQGLPGAGTPGGDEARDTLDRAGRAMDGAEDALRRDDLAGAIDRQAEAMENLREGMRQLSEALAENGQRNPGQQGEAQDRMAGQQGADPLGRNQRGAPGVDQNMLQGEDVYRRARDLLDEIRRRSGDPTRPEVERNYLERLLDRF